MDKKAAIYLQGASPDNEDRSLEQEGACRRYCEEQGWGEVSLLEHAAPARNLQHPQIDALGAAVKAGDISVVVAPDLFHLSSCGPDLLRLWKGLMRAGVELHTLFSGHIDQVEALLYEIATLHEDRQAEPTGAAFARRAREGNAFVGTNPPYGYRSARTPDDQIVLLIDDEEARVVQLVYQWYTEEGCARPPGACRIAKKLTRLGIPRRADKCGRLTGTPGVWSTSTVMNILSNETYTGTWYYRKTDRAKGQRQARPREEQIAVAVPAIISQETWEAARRRRRRDQRRFRPDRHEG